MEKIIVYEIRSVVGTPRKKQNSLNGSSKETKKEDEMIQLKRLYEQKVQDKRRDRKEQKGSKRKKKKDIVIFKKKWFPNIFPVYTFYV